MGRPDIVAWFDENGYPAFRRADGPGWEALPPRDRVLALVGAVLDAIVGSDRYTLYEQSAGRHAAEMAEAFGTIGLPDTAAALRAINAAFAGGRPAADDAEREEQVDALPAEAWEPWRAIKESFERWVP
jgi:hypothetical protein